MNTKRNHLQAVADSQVSPCSILHPVLLTALLAVLPMIVQAGTSTARIANVTGGTPGTYYQYLAKEVRAAALPATFTFSVQFNNGLTANPLNHFVHGCDVGDVTISYPSGDLAERQVTLTLNAGATGKNPVISFVNANTPTLNNDACRVVCNGKDTASFQELQAVEDAMDYGKHTKASSNSAFNIAGSNKLIDGAANGLYPNWRSGSSSTSTVEPPSGTWPDRYEWLFIDLGARYDISRVVMNCLSGGPVEQYRIRISNKYEDEPDGTSTTDLYSDTSWYGWTTIEDITDGRMDIAKEDFDWIGTGGHVYTRYLKIELLKAVGTATSYRVAEVDVYGDLYLGGWTEIQPSVDTTTIYVSSSTGNDLNDGLSETTPVQTLSKGMSLARDGYPDHVLLKRGDVWQDQNLGAKSGRSETEPFLISYYGASGARPKLMVSAKTINKTLPISNFALIGLHIVKYTMDPNDPGYTGYNGGNDALIRFIAAGSENLLFEDNKTEFGEWVIDSVGGKMYNVTIRRNIIVDAWCQNSSTTDDHACGVYMSAVDGILIEENLFDHNGWNEQIPGAGRNMYAHNMYLQTDNAGDLAVVRGNITARAASNGLQQRMGGWCEDNLAVANSSGLAPIGGASEQPAGTIAYAFNNVVMEGVRQDPEDSTNPQTSAVYGLHLGDSVQFDYRSQGNIVANRIQNGANAGLSTNGFSVDDILYNWNTDDMWNPNWENPNRSIGTYHGTLGKTATLEAFLEEARNRGPAQWPEEYTAYAVNDYIRAGYAATATPTTALPNSLTAQDIGVVGTPGTALYTPSSNTYTLEGEGSLGGTTDEFHFVYKQMTGDFTVLVKVVYQENTDSWARSGIMVRESLNADSVMANVCNAGLYSNGTNFQRRVSTGATASNQQNNGSNLKKRPQTLKLVRSGNDFSAYSTPDNGLNWYQIGTTQSIPMNQTVYVGMCASSNAPGVLSTAAFLDLQIVQ